MTQTNKLLLPYLIIVVLASVAYAGIQYYGAVGFPGDGSLRFTEQVAPGTPPSNTVAFYAKSDGLFYGKDDAGTETSFSNVVDTLDATVGAGASTAQAVSMTGANTFGAAGVTTTIAGTSNLTILDGVITSVVTTGTAPFVVASTTLVTNLNADLLDGVQGSLYGLRTDYPDGAQLDGDHVDIDFTPVNYTPDAAPAEAADIDDLAAHLKGIDTALGGVGAQSVTLLDGSEHTDTASQTASRGSIIIGNASSKWDELTVGGATFVLTSDGTDVAWAANDGANVVDTLDATVGAGASTAQAVSMTGANTFGAAGVTTTFTGASINGTHVDGTWTGSVFKGGSGSTSATTFRGSSANTGLYFTNSDTYAHMSASANQIQTWYNNRTSFWKYAEFPSGSGTMQIVPVTVSLQSVSGPTAVATNLIPAYTYYWGVHVRVAATVTGASSWDCGDGSDQDRWGNDLGLAIGTEAKSSTYDYGVSPSGWTGSAISVTLTANTSDFTGGNFVVAAWYVLID